MRAWFRGRLGSLRRHLFGLGEPIPTDDQPVAALMQCTHPSWAWTACTWQLGPKGKYAWLMRCTLCGAWFSC